MIASQRIVLFILCLTLLHYGFDFGDAGMKGLLYLKQLFDLSIPGKPSAQLIAGMSHLYTRNSTTKYFTKSPLVNELLIENRLAKRNIANLSALVSLDYLWIYLPLCFIMYPFLHDSTVSCYRFIKDYYLFHGELARVTNNVYIHESTMEINQTSEEEPATAASRRTSVDSSTEPIELDYRNTAENNLTAEELFAKEILASGAPKKRDEVPFEPTKSQRFWSDSDTTNTGRITRMSTPSFGAINSDGRRVFQLPTASSGSIFARFPESHQGNTPHPTLNVPPVVGSSSNATGTAGPSKPSRVSTASKPAPAPGSSKPTPTAGKPATTTGPSKKPTTIGRRSKPVPSKPFHTTSLLKLSRPSEKKDSPPFDGHTTPPEHPRFAPRPLPRSNELARVATANRFAKDLADQMAAYLTQQADGNVPRSNTAAGSKQQGFTTVANPPASHADATRHAQHLPRQVFKRAQAKFDPVFTSSFQHLRGTSGTATAANIAARHNHGTPSGNSEAIVGITGSSSPEASTDAKTTTLPVSLMGMQPSSNTNQTSMVAGLALDQLDENFFATTLGAVQPSSPDPSPVNSSAISTGNAGFSINPAATFLANDLQGLQSAHHVSENSTGGEFQSIELLPTDTNAPPAAFATVDLEEPRDSQVDANAMSAFVFSEASSSQSYIRSADATHPPYSFTMASRETTSASLVKTKEKAQGIAAGTHSPSLGSGTPLYSSISLSPGADAAEASTSRSQTSAATPSSDNGSRIDEPSAFLSNTERTVGEQESGAILPSYPPEEIVKTHSSEGLLQSLQKKAEEQVNQQENTSRAKSKGKRKSNKKKKGKRR
ncbi:hypothetical protein MBANPS3_004381 [Mucor bainieri]